MTACDKDTWLWHNRPGSGEGNSSWQLCRGSSGDFNLDAVSEKYFQRRRGRGGAHTQDISQQEPALGGASVKSTVSRAGHAGKRPVKVPEGSASLARHIPPAGAAGALRGEDAGGEARARLCRRAPGGGGGGWPWPEVTAATCAAGGAGRGRAGPCVAAAAAPRAREAAAPLPKVPPRRQQRQRERRQHRQQHRQQRHSHRHRHGHRHRHQHSHRHRHQHSHSHSHSHRRRRAPAPRLGAGR